ncbi:hypothetical protein BaRGS_00035012 [Batillaria attramentaria]|uniref:Uncharacterized protein n=1 Tax=Batillaria attramentaria TaxID=370345 RepID=A0ABD0JFP5_9CAEN
MGITTRAAAAKGDKILERINRTRCPIQINFDTDTLHGVHHWRLALHCRYVQSSLPHDLTSTWIDRNKNHDPVTSPIQRPYHSDLHNTIIQLWEETTKTVTITLFYTTGKVRAQGNYCQTGRGRV